MININEHYASIIATNDIAAHAQVARLTLRNTIILAATWHDRVSVNALTMDIVVGTKQSE